MTPPEPLEADDYQFLIGMAVDLVPTVLDSDRLHVPTPQDVRLYDDRMGLSCADHVDQRLNVGYRDGFVTGVWVG